MPRRRGRYVHVNQPCEALIRARASWLTPELESYMRRWVSNGRPPESRFIDESYWQWLLEPDENLRAVRAMSADELNAKLPDVPEAADGEWRQTHAERFLEAVFG